MVHFLKFTPKEAENKWRRPSWGRRK